jgi:2-methylcitrate dehydratase PrpD
MSAIADAFEGRHGFLRAYGDADEIGVEAIKKGLGAPWKILDPGVLFKRYPSCTGTHPGIEAVLELLATHSFTPDEIDSITVLTDPAGPDMLKFNRPKDVLEAQFSMHFCIALAIKEGDITLEQFTDQKMKDLTLRLLMDRITVEVDPELAKKGYLNRSETTVRIKLKDGRDLSRKVSIARGNPERSFSAGELEDKFLKCAHSNKRITERAALQCVEMVRNLEDLSVMTELGNLLSGD